MHSHWFIALITRLRLELRFVWRFVSSDDEPPRPSNNPFPPPPPSFPSLPPLPPPPTGASLFIALSHFSSVLANPYPNRPAASPLSHFNDSSNNAHHIFNGTAQGHGGTHGHQSRSVPVGPSVLDSALPLCAWVLLLRKKALWFTFPVGTSRNPNYDTLC